MSSPDNVTPEQIAKATKLRKITATMLVVFSLILLGWDIDVANNDVRDDTISELLRDLSHRYWLLPFTLMGVMGHLFWNKPGTERAMQFNKLLCACAVVGARDLVNLVFPLPTLPAANAGVAVLGFILGARWWPQLMPGVKQTDRSDVVEPAQDESQDTPLP